MFVVAVRWTIQSLPRLFHLLYLLALQVLRFYAYFEENILFSPEEDYRVRPVVIYYYLEDDSMCIIEPKVENSGMSQGTRLKRQRLPKNDRGEHYLWKDLNLGMDLEVYGFKYHIIQCDAFTKVRHLPVGSIFADTQFVLLYTLPVCLIHHM